MSFIRILKYAILGIVNKEPASGYDIAKTFNESLVQFWNAKHSQIYPELKKLNDEGLITYETCISGQVLERKVYSITEEGKRSLIDWISKNEVIEPTPKDRFRLRVFFSNMLDSDTYKDLLSYQLIQRKEKLIFLNDRMKKFGENPPSFGDKGYGDYIVLEGAILREEAYVEWIKKCLESIK